MPAGTDEAPTWADEKYVSLTTFKRDGTPRPTPIWIVGHDGGRLAAFTEPDQWKVKRARSNPRVELRPCDKKGLVPPDAPTATGTVEVSTDRAVFRSVARRIRAKYPLEGHLMLGGLYVKQALLRRNLRPECCLLITLDDLVT